ncbi:MAG: methyltransferase domain-containing protein, partial [Phycisphaerae bacterium]|nr:methyltransferase domain-containing protein [Phycisphaerae bacterium]
GPPGTLGVLDAGCGTGHQAIAMAQAGYRMTGLDRSEAMLRVASQRAADAGVHIAWSGCAFDALNESVTHRFDGLYCIGNSLAAAGSEAAVRSAIDNFAAVLRPGGRLFIQVLNFAPMRDEHPCVRGPRIVRVEGVEYVSFRLFHVGADESRVTSLTLWNDGQWRHHAKEGRTYPVSPEQMDAWLAAAGLRVDGRHGDYALTPFDAETSVDFIVTAVRE